MEAAAPGRPEPYGFTIPATPLVFRWPAASLPIRVWAQPIGDFPEIARDALDAWQAAAVYGEFRGIMVADSNRADVIITVVPGGQPYETDELPCVEFLPFFVAHDTTIGLPLRASVLARLGATAAEVNSCIPTMVLHEVGHVLGLFRHSPDSADVMFSNPRATVLSARDRSTLITLYHTRPNVGLPKVVLSTPLSSGPAPFASELTANVSDSATTALTYRFWWNCADAGTDVDAVTAVCGDPAEAEIGMVFLGVLDDPLTVTHRYPAAGEYTAKVIVSRAIPRPMEHRLAITVSTP